MAVYDRWHVKKPRGPAETCKEHSRGDTVLYKSAEHGKGDRWQVRWRDLHDKQCSENRPLKEGRNPAIHAEARDKEIQGQLLSGGYVDPSAGKVTLLAYARDWLTAQTADPSTLDRLDRWYRLRLDGSAIAAMEMAALARRPTVIQQWVKGLTGQGLSASSVGQALGTLSSVFGAALDDGIIARNPCRSKTVRPPKPAERKIVPLTFEQCRDLRAGLPGRYRAMADCGFRAGLRGSETLGLGPAEIGPDLAVVRQVKYAGGRLYFAPPKGGKIRTVPLDDATVLLLTEHLETFGAVEVALPWGAPDGRPVAVPLLFPMLGGQGGPARAMRRAESSRLWIAARRSAGVPVTAETGWHLLRHTAASAWLAGGSDIMQVAEWLGHSDPRTTWEYYAHLRPDREQIGRQAMAAFCTPLEDKIQKGSARHVP